MKPDLTPPSADEARASLAEIDLVGVRVRKAIAAGSLGPLLILWGFIWIAGFATTQLRPEAAARAWCWLDGAGIVISFFVGWIWRRAQVDPARRKIGLAWLIFLAYGALWMLLLMPEAFGAGWMASHLDYGHRLGAFWVSLSMFGYVAMGLWLGRFLFGLGLLVTALTVAGLFLFPGSFYAWMAVTGGGALVSAGVYVACAWR